MEVELTGVVVQIRFLNEKTGFTVFVLETEEKEQIVVTGTFYKIRLKERIRVTGQMIQDRKYGRQLKMDHYENIIPSDVLQLEEYLSSGLIRGIGKKTAKLIIGKFGKDTFSVLKENPTRLYEIRGIGRRKAEIIGESIKEETEEKDVVLFLNNFGITPILGRKIYKTFEGKTYRILQKNPYKLTMIDGVGFKIADSIALKNKIPADSEFRIESGLHYILESRARFGDTCFPKAKIEKMASKELALDQSVIVPVLENMIQNGKLVQTERNGKIVLYEPFVYENEIKVSKKLLDLYAHEYEIEDVSLSSNRLDETQMSAVSMAARYGFMVLTGGPGCGKTFTTKMIIEYFEKCKKTVLLAAPTGRAAKRMEESTGRSSQTIHRLLEIQEGKFTKCAEDPLDCDALIIDEVSMLDFSLFVSLLDAVPENCHLVFVGDKNQLPSVGAGNVLGDIIRSDIFPVCELKKIYRQSENSDIVANAHHILNGEDMEFHNKDFFYISSNTPENIINRIIHYAAESLPAFTGEKDIQVLCPLRVRNCGTENLNIQMQAAMNPQPELIKGFRKNDKVIQMKNNYDITRHYSKNGHKYQASGVFNGDTGKVDGIDRENEYLIVLMDDGGKVKYKFNELDQLELAYALTIHKSQGSEYPVVIIPIYDYIPTITTMNLLYTGITRAKKCILLIGRKETLIHMLKNRNIASRCTGLSHVVKELGKNKQQL